MQILYQIVIWAAILVGILLSVVVALQTEKSEGLGGVLAGGGGGGGKVGKDLGLDRSSKVLAYTWLALVAIAALVR